MFECECGARISKPIAYVRCGKTSSCGCLRKQVTAQSRFKDLTGQKIGRLTVLEALPERTAHKHVQWRCLCECGNTTITTNLGKKNPTRSCGCIRVEQMRKLGASSKQANPISRTSAYKAALKAVKRQRAEVVVAERVSRLLSMALSAVGAVKSGSTFAMLGYTPAELRVHIERQFVVGMTWENRHEWQIDHITPISTAKTKADVIALNQLSNLRPLWSILNNQKKAKRHHLL